MLNLQTDTDTLICYQVYAAIISYYVLSKMFWSAVGTEELTVKITSMISISIRVLLALALSLALTYFN